MKAIKLYYHKTSGGAKYLMDTYLKWEHNGKKGKEWRITDKTKYVIRLDGNLETDCELTIVKNQLLTLRRSTTPLHH